MKEVKFGRNRKFIKNFMELTPDISMKNNIDGKNVMLLDDLIATGTTTAEMIRNIHLYSPNSVFLLTFITV